jgi:hypothetical protein
MPYTTVYLQYIETRTTQESGEDSDADEFDDEDDFDTADMDSDEDKVVVEFFPIKLTTAEPRGDSLELELDFEAEAGNELHIVVVRFNNYKAGLLEEWCVEKVFQSVDAAEDFVENLEDGWSASECADTDYRDSVIVKAEVFSMLLK